MLPDWKEMPPQITLEIAHLLKYILLDQTAKSMNIFPEIVLRPS